MIEITENNLKELDKMRYYDSFYAYCKKCGAKYIINSFRPERLERYKTLLCEKCHRNYLDLKTHGVTYYTNRFKASNTLKNKSEIEKDISNKKSKETRLKIYGDPNYNNPEKREKTNIIKYGVNNVFQNEEIKNKSKQTCLNLYGVEYYIQSETGKNKIFSKNRSNHNGFHNMQTEEGKRLWFKSNLKNHGGLLYQQLPEVKRNFVIRMHTEDIKQKALETNRSNHGGVLAFQSNECLQKRLKLRRDNPEKYATKRYICYGYCFDSSVELCVYLFCIYNNIPIIRNSGISFQLLDMYGNIRYVYPDFIISGRLVEIKGSMFYKPDGTWYLPWKGNLSDEEYLYNCDLRERKRQCLIQNNVLILRDNDPFILQCVNWVNTQINHLTNLYIKSNPNNFCYGVTPYNKNINSEYTDIPTIGSTPFNK